MTVSYTHLDVYKRQKNTLFPFLRYVKIKLKKEIEKKYITPSQLISIEEQKIINLYLSKKDEHFLTEEEIRERLQINSGKMCIRDRIKTNIIIITNHNIF